MHDIRLNGKKLKNTNTATGDAVHKLLELFVVETMYASIVNTFSPQSQNQIPVVRKYLYSCVRETKNTNN